MTFSAGAQRSRHFEFKFGGTTMDRRRVVITGLGAVTPVGLTAADSWQAVRSGVCGIAPITQFDASSQKLSLIHI